MLLGVFRLFFLCGLDAIVKPLLFFSFFLGGGGGGRRGKGGGYIFLDMPF